MTIKKSTVNDGAVYVTHPVFSDETDGDNIRRMNGFYDTLAELAKEASAKLPPGYRYSAEYTAYDTDGELIISYTVRVRHCGRSIFRRNFTHRWKNGVIISEEIEQHIAQS